MYEAIEHFTGVNISKMDESSVLKTAQELGVNVNHTMARGKLIDAIFGENARVK